MPGVASGDLLLLRRITDRIVLNLRIPTLLVFAPSGGGWCSGALIVLARAAPLPLPLRL